MRWRLPLATCSFVLLLACAPGGRVTTSGTLPAPEATARTIAVRAAVGRFLDAYVRAPSDDGRSLVAMAGSPALQHWAAWLGVQFKQVSGSVDGSYSLRTIGPAQPVQLTEGGSGALVEIAADVTFQISLDSRPARTQSRSLDGLMLLIAPEGTEATGWRVADFTRDGTALSSSVHVFRVGTGVQERGVTIVLDSFILDANQWAIGLVVRNETKRKIVIEPELVGTFDISGSPIDRGLAPATLDTISPGDGVEALVAYPIPKGEELAGLRLVVGARIPGESDPVLAAVAVQPLLRALERVGTGGVTPSPAGSA